jgi:uncharacterized protein (TIGR03437 family)
VYAIIGSPATPFFSIQLTASVGSSKATFYLTQALPNQGGQGGGNLVNVGPFSKPDSLSGAAGSSGAAISVQVGSSNGYVPNVALRLVSSQDSPSVSCAPPPSGGPVPDPGTVLTDSNGVATCIPVLAGSGSGRFFALLGGLEFNTEVVNDDGTFGGPAGYASTGYIPLTVTAPQPGGIQVTGGNYQSAYASQALSTSLSAIVRDTTQNPIAGQVVNWTCSPSTAGTFTRTSTTSDANGQVQNGFTFSGTANGVVTITATISGTGFQAPFSETALQLLTVQSFQRVSGDSPVQSAKSGQVFANPLVVQANYNNGQPASGVIVSFSVSGPASFTTSPTPATDNSGRASVSLLALSTTAQSQVTVTATLGSLQPITFQLTVIPLGPVIGATSFFNAADMKPGSVSPCSLAIVTGAGIAPNAQGTVVGAVFGPAPLSLQGTSITFATGGNTLQAPIFSISNANGTQSATFQVPCEASAGAVASVTVAVGGGSATVTLPVLAASPGVYGAVGPDGVTRAVLARADGSFVSLANPARRGETITAFVTGLGPTTPPVSTNQIPPRGAVATVNGTVITGVGVGGVAPLYSIPQLTADLVGVYQVSFVIPANVSSGNNVGFSIGVIPAGSSVANYSNLTYIPVQ